MIAADIVDNIVVGRANWSELFAKHDFFSKYRYYLQVTASTGKAELQLKWCAISCCDVSWFDKTMDIIHAGLAPWSPEYGNSS